MDDAEKIAEFWKYARIYGSRTTRLNTIEHVMAWIAARVGALEASSWARLGYTAETSAPHRAAGVTPSMVRTARYAEIAAFREMSDEIAAANG